MGVTGQSLSWSSLSIPMLQLLKSDINARCMATVLKCGTGVRLEVDLSETSVMKLMMSTAVA